MNKKNLKLIISVLSHCSIHSRSSHVHWFVDHQINTLMMIKAKLASNWPSVYSRDLQIFFLRGGVKISTKKKRIS